MQGRFNSQERRRRWTLYESIDACFGVAEKKLMSTLQAKLARRVALEEAAMKCRTEAKRFAQQAKARMPGRASCGDKDGINFWRRMFDNAADFGLACSVKMETKLREAAHLGRQADLVRLRMKSESGDLSRVMAKRKVVQARLLEMRRMQLAGLDALDSGDVEEQIAVDAWRA